MKRPPSYLLNQLPNKCWSFFSIILCTLATSTTYAQPTIDDIDITSTPTDGYYTESTGNNVITVTVTFDEDVQWKRSAPTLDIEIGSSTYRAEISDPTAVDTLRRTFTFTYTVRSGEMDNDGISIPCNPIRGTIENNSNERLQSTDRNDCRDTNSNKKQITNDEDHKVDAVKPELNRIEITSDPGTDNTYIPEDEILFTVTFSEDIDNSGTLPDFHFQIGSVNKMATYDLSKTNTYKTDNNITDNNVLVFKYEVQSGDEAPNGIAYESDPFQQQTSTQQIMDEAGNDCACMLSRSQGPHSHHKVKTSKPQLESLKIDSIPIHFSGHRNQNDEFVKDTYYRGEFILFEATFNEEVRVVRTEGTPQVKFNMGDTEKQAEYSSEHDDDGDGKTITFAYEVTVDDLDINGIQIPSTDPIFSLKAPNQNEVESVITDLFGNPSILSLSQNQATDTENLLQTQNRDTALPLHRVDGLRVGLEPDTVHINDINITSQNPQIEPGEQVFVHLTFNETVTVNNSSGTPFITIEVGDMEKEAYYSHLTGNNTLVFAYTIQSGDGNTGINDIVVPGGKIDPNGGSIRPGTTGKELDLRFSDYDPKGGITVAQTSIPSNSTGYGQGDVFTVNLTFDGCLSVDGRPSMNIKVGSTNRKARSSSINCNSGMSTILPFSYTLSTQDTNLDPIYVPKGTVNLDGASITTSGTEESFPVDINLQHGEANTIIINDIMVNSSGPYDHNNMDKIIVDVVMSDNVEVSELDVGKPSINIRVKGQNRRATYDDTSHSDGTLTFSYEVTASDSMPEDGDIMVPETGSISLNRSKIRNLSHKRIDLNYNFSETAQTLSPITVQSLNITSEGPYVPNNNDKILIDVTFSAPVTVVQGIPLLPIQVGGNDRFADYSLSDDMNNIDNILTFVYQVTGSDSNMDNIVIPQGRINTNGSMINDVTQLRNVHLTHSSQGGGDVTPPTPPTNDISVDSINIQSNDGSEVLIDVIFSDDVEITGRNAPSINIQVGGNNRRAFYSSSDDASDTDNILTFSYRFTRSDSNTDNIAIPTGQIDLRGSTINDSSGSSRTVSLNLPTYEPPDTGTPEEAPCDPTDLNTNAALLENPVNNSIKSGVHIISGWACEARRVEVYLNDNPDPYPLLYGADRKDTECVCGDSNNGFIGLFNYNLLKDGPQTITLHIDGREVSRRRFRVVTLGEEFVRNESASGELNLSNGVKTFFKWEQARQGFDIIGFRSKANEPEPLSPDEPAKPGGFLELPRDGSIKSGVHIISGWVCRARKLTLKIHNADTEEEVEPINILYGSERRDTEEACNDINNGFATIFNYNILEAGTYIADLYVDDRWQDSSKFKVVRMGQGPNYEFVRGVSGTGTVEMEISGQIVTLGWEQATQGFEIKAVKDPE